MTSNLKRIEKNVFFGIFEKRVTLTIYRVIDYFRDLKTCADPDFFSKRGEEWSPRHIFGYLIRKILKKNFQGGVFLDALDPL